MNNYASIEYIVLDNRLKSYIKELIQYKKMNKDNKSLRKKYNITLDDNNKIKKYMIEKKFFPSAEFRNDSKFNNNLKKNNDNDEINDDKLNTNSNIVNIQNNISNNEMYDNRFSGYATNIDKKKNNIINYRDQYLIDSNNAPMKFKHMDDFENINDNDNVFKNPLYFDDSKTNNMKMEKIPHQNQNLHVNSNEKNNQSNFQESPAFDETFHYKYPLYPASHNLDSHVKKHEMGGNKIKNSMDQYNKIYNKNSIDILTTNELTHNSSNLMKSMNIDVENEFKKGLPSRAFINDKRNREYDNPIEHYFSYIDNDIQDPNHVVMEYPKSTRLSNKQHMQKYNM